MARVVNSNGRLHSMANNHSNAQIFDHLGFVPSHLTRRSDIWLDQSDLPYKFR
ncbi:hypothetical protein FAM19404_02674 [Lacticaseibacillus paracasei]|nr:hypothetical protein FAM19404_02674 [Lacticaseibacillus paracasei]